VEKAVEDGGLAVDEGHMITCALAPKRIIIIIIHVNMERIDTGVSLLHANEHLVTLATVLLGAARVKESDEDVSQSGDLVNDLLAHLLVLFPLSRESLMMLAKGDACSSTTITTGLATARLGRSTADLLLKADLLLAIFRELVRLV